jgi:hypothetical protein
LEHRDSSGSASPLQLRAVLFDATNGGQRSIVNWGVQHPYGGVVCTPEETFVAITPDRLRRYTLGLNQTAELPIPPPSGPQWVPWALYTSPSGRSLLLKYYEPRFSPSKAPSQVERELITTDDDYEWVDARTLSPLQIWTEPLRGDFITFSDTAIARIGRPIQAHWERIELRAVTGSWRRAAETKYHGEPRFVSNAVLALVRHDGLSLVGTDGTAIFNHDLGHNEHLVWLWKPEFVAPSADGGRLAVSVWVTKGGSTLLDIPGHPELKRIQVLDIPARKWVYTLDARRQKIKTISALALSPDGSLMAVMYDGIVTVYRLPPAGAER